MDEFLSVSDISLICNVNLVTVRRWLKSGQLKGQRINDWLWLIARADLDAALTSGAIRKSPPRGRRPIAMLGTKQLK